MLNIINDIGSFVDYFNTKISEINKIIFRQYGIYDNKINSLDVNEREMLQLPFTKSIILDDMLRKISRGEEMELDTEDLESTFLVSTFSSFYEIISAGDEKLLVSELDSFKIEDLYLDKKTDLSKGDIIFVFVYQKDGRNYMYENFVKLSEDEGNKIAEIYAEYYIDNELDVYFENIVIQRLMSKYLSGIDDVITKYNYELRDRFDQESLYNFFKHINNTAKYSFFYNKNISLYNLDYFKFIKEEGDQGNFVIEGDLEDFLDILELIVFREYSNNSSYKKAYESVRYCLDNIFILRNSISKKFPLTPIEMIYDIDDILSQDSNNFLEIATLGFFIESLVDKEIVEYTKKTKRLSKKTIRDYTEEYFISSFGEGHDIQPQISQMLELASAILLSNGLAGIDDNNRLYLKNRYTFFLSPNPTEMIANLIVALFRRENLEEYFNKKNIDYEEVLEEIKEAVVENKIYKLLNLKIGEEVIAFLELIGVIKIIYLNDNSFYQLEKLGEYLANIWKPKKQSAKILKLAKYK